MGFDIALEMIRLGGDDAVGKVRVLGGPPTYTGN